MIGKKGSRRLHPDVVALDEKGNRVYNIRYAVRERNPEADRYPLLER